MSKLTKTTSVVHLDETPTKKTFKKVVAEGIAMYASVHTPKKAYNPEDAPAYSLDLIVDDETAATLALEGLKPAKTIVDENTKKLKEYAQYPGKKVFTFKRKTAKRDGTAIAPLQVVDSELQPLSSSILIGNGSKVNVSINPYKVMFQGKEVTGHTLLGVQVLDLVKYENEGLGFNKTKGFKIPSLPTSTTSDDCPFDTE